MVLHYGNIQETKECLKSLEGLDYPNFKIIVVNNDPTINLVKQLHNARLNIRLNQCKFLLGSQRQDKNTKSGQQIIIINNKKNLGFAGGMNVGIRETLKKKADYILLLNNDTIIIKPGFLKKLVEVGECNERVGILGPVIYKYNKENKVNKEKIHFSGGKINWLYIKGKHLIFNNKQRIVNSDYVTGACMLIKSGVIEKIGLMDEDYFLYFEDVDWCIKAQKAGYKCVVVPAAKIWHKISSNTEAESFSYIYYHIRNGLLFAKKNAPFFIKIFAYFWSFLFFGEQLIKLIILPAKKKWAKAIMLGIKDFYRKKLGRLEID